MLYSEYATGRARLFGCRTPARKPDGGGSDLKGGAQSSGETRLPLPATFSHSSRWVRRWLLIAFVAGVRGLLRAGFFGSKERS